MRRISQISDLHFGRTDPAAVEGLVAELNGEPPDLIVASGDFTMAGRRREYEEARAFLARLPRPWIAVPGNHDLSPYHITQRFLKPFARYRRYICPETEPVFEDDEIGVVGLNTVRRWAPERDWSQGRIGRRQILRAASRLNAMPPHLFRIVVGHHPFMPPPWDEEARIVGHAVEALAAFRECGVGLTLAGHLHRHYARFAQAGTGGVQTDGSRPDHGKGRLLAVQAGSATSTRLRGNEPNAYNRITIDAGRVSVTARIWTGKTWEDAPDAKAAK
ncbi:MAG: metallophosphoesterase [Methylobacterium sp.]|uniref:metallophosphoesterase family protein n=1 Tax=Methylobacterium sp. TaxID=409 RepID=UPI0025FF04CF|nr:metallophosphoesterase [Methylobacterium sp.]MBX9931435.1 metallophosphoesterase [Methylobacterium sp.]